MADDVSIQLPQPQIQFLDPTGGVSRAWLYYFLTLLKRTGGVPGVSVAEIQQEIKDILAELVSLEVMTEEASMPLSEPPPNQLPFSVGSIFPADAEPPIINPILAALLVADVS